MYQPSLRDNVEFFHLVFLRGLVAKGEDKALVALKGGCNLRFYFGSARYSEDIDFDVAVMSKETLKNKVERLFKSPLLLTPLKSKGLEIVETSAPKQTDTTQRWKVGLRASGLSVPLRTKIEFSRRDKIIGTAYEAIQAEVLRPYSLSPSLATHYSTRAAVSQKIHALAARAEPQARDVFDLHVLLARPDALELSLDETQKLWLPSALERTIGVSFDEYTSKVVAYLAPAHADLYASRPTWEAMQEAVVASLESLQ